MTAAAAIASSAAACSSSASQPIAASNATETSASADPTASAGGSTTGPGGASPDAALSTFLLNVIKGDFTGACKMTAELKDNGTLASSSPAACAAASSDAQVEAVFKKLQLAVSPHGALGAIPVVKVDGVTATGRSVTVMPSQITVGNRPLQTILAGNPADGIESFPVQKIGKRWYVLSFL
jgi:hypothetical protein